MAKYKAKGSGLDLSGVGKRTPMAHGGSNPRGGLSFASNQKQGKKQSRSSIPKSATSFTFAGGKTKQESRKSTIRWILVIVVALAVAVGVGKLVYDYSVNNSLRPTLDEDTLSSALAKPEETTATWTLFVKTDSESGESGRGSIEKAALIYVDSENETMSVLWVPPETRVYVAGYGYKTASEAFSLGVENTLGAEGTVINAISTLTNAPISHYMEMNQAGFEKYVDAANITPETDGVSEADAYMYAVCKKILGSSSEQMGTQIDLLLQYAASDMDSDAASSMMSPIRGLAMDTNFSMVDVPIEETADGQSELISDQWLTIMTRLASGKSAVASASEESQNEVMRSICNITIWNGVGVSGIANDCADHLRELGWDIESVGNAASFVYEETLVVYKADDDKELADLVVSDLGQGRAVRSAARYSFSGDILVVVGKDYQPY